MSQPGTTPLLGRVLAKTSPDGKGKVAYVFNIGDEQKLPPGIAGLYVSVGTAYGEDEACESPTFLTDVTELNNNLRLPISRSPLLPSNLSLPCAFDFELGAVEDAQRKGPAEWLGKRRRRPYTSPI